MATFVEVAKKDVPKITRASTGENQQKLQEAYAKLKTVPGMVLRFNENSLTVKQARSKTGGFKNAVGVLNLPVKVFCRGQNIYFEMNKEVKK